MREGRFLPTPKPTPRSRPGSPFVEHILSSAVINIRQVAGRHAAQKVRLPLRPSHEVGVAGVAHAGPSRPYVGNNGDPVAAWIPGSGGDDRALKGLG
jgi:hypothetical protein